MKILLVTGLLIACSAFADVCELNPVLDLEAMKVKILMENKDVPKSDSDLVIHFPGVNQNKLNCENLIKEIKKTGIRTVEIEGEDIPLQLIHTINL